MFYSLEEAAIKPRTKLPLHFRTFDNEQSSIPVFRILFYSIDPIDQNLVILSFFYSFSGVEVEMCGSLRSLEFRATGCLIMYL